MAILNYKDLNLSIKKINRKFKWGDKEIEVLGYLPIESKYDIVMITLQKSFEDGIYNQIKLDMYYHLNLVYAYTNLTFSDEERTDEAKLYDEMMDSGFMIEFLKNLDVKAYTEMQEDIDNIAELKMKNDASAASFLRTFVDDLPGGLERAQQIVDNFNPEQYQAVKNFAEAANGGRPIP